ncbi:MAG: bifunctional glycosyltransferase/class I SAM-dependent methyltransferase, partial [Ilumatobacteraceae bacterium]
ARAAAAAPAPAAAPARIGVLVVAYNAETTLAGVLDRLPATFRERVAAVLVCDDASSDGTYRVGLEYRELSDLPLTVIRHPVNLGYGGNQKSGYRWAIEQELDVVVLLHGDGQYAPEIIDRLVDPLAAGECDAVFGSRMLEPGAARRGGMPMYKYLGNRVLTRYENAVAGLRLSEWHSGYRAYRVDALSDIPFESGSDGFDFDTEVILQLHEAGKTIREVPIPTYYGDEICHVNGMRYAADVAVDVTRYRLHKLGFGSGATAFADDHYELKLTETSSHGRLLARMASRAPARVLDLGCADGRFGALLRDQGHTVVGVDVTELDGVAERLDHFVAGNLDDGLPAGIGAGFDVVVAADVLEHTVRPAELLAALRDVLAPDGVMLVSLPNFAHWYPRVRVLLGRFDYDRRGILDAGHVRFFTWASAQRMFRDAGYRVADHEVVGLPVEVAERGGDAPPLLTRAIASIDRLGLRARPTLFGYQFVYELRPAPVG